MEKNFNVKSFVEEYEKQIAASDKDSFLMSKLKSEKYLPYSDKLLTAESIVRSTSYALVREEDGLKKTDKIEINSPMRYILFVMTIVDKYTNISVDFKNIMPDFDGLNRNGLIEIIFAKVGDKETGEFNTIMEMVLNDFMANKYQFKNYVGDMFSKFYTLVQQSYPLIDNIINKLENMTEEDAKKLSKLFGKFEKFVK